MALKVSRIVRKEWDVDARLAQLALTRTKLLEVRSIAVGAAADATPFHPANAAGTFSYQYGTFGLRNEFVDDQAWKADRPNGVEAIVNKSLRLRIIFANVDIACDDEHEPKSRSDRGAGAERLCSSNTLFSELPRFIKTDPLSKDGWVTFFLMVAPNGAVELSCAKVVNGQFSNFIERIYLSDGTDLELEIKRPPVEAEVQEFDPQVSRRSNG